MRSRGRALSSSTRFALAVSVVFIATAILMGAVIYIQQSSEEKLRLQRDVERTVEGLSVMAGQDDLEDLHYQLAAEVAASQDGEVLVAFIDAATGRREGNFEPKEPFTGPRELRPGVDFSSPHVAAGKEDERYFAYGRRVPRGWLMAARDDRVLDENRAILFRNLATGLSLAIALSAGLALWIAWRNDARIARMETVLQAVGDGDPSLRIREQGDDDLARLARRVDATLDRLETGVAALRQVTTDVAHDLRAPLARLRLRLEPLALGPELPDAARREIGDALDDLDGISASFDAILRLSRMQAGMVEPHRAPVDLGELAEGLHEMLLPVAEDLGDTLCLAAPAAPVVVQGDHMLLQQAVTNLVENALRHCPAPARIEIAVSGGPGGAEISVRDDGPGIPEDQRHRVLERFVRLDQSRHTPGSGLGLALVAAIAGLHDADLRLEDARPGLRARLIFPPGDARRARDLTDL